MKLPVLYKQILLIKKALRDPRIIVLIAPFILLSPVWARGRALYWGTPSTQFVPWWVQAWEIVGNGQLPLWNPLLGMGTPLLANYQSALLYPGTWIYFLLYRLGGTPLMAWGMAPMLALHLAIAGIGMLILLRQLGLNKFSQSLGALAFGLSGYLVARGHFLSMNAALAWLPWILWASYRLIQKPDRKKILYLAILLALQWLAGHAQIAWYSLMLMGLWSIFWIWSDSSKHEYLSILAKLSLSIAFAFALSAIQLIPTLEFLFHSSRASQIDPQLALNYSFWPWRVITIILPNFFGNPAHGNFWGFGNFWEDAVYIGLIPILLAIFWGFKSKINARNQNLRKFLFSLGLLGLILAMGNNTPLFPWLFENIPSFNLFQAPTRFNIWLVISLAILAAFAAQDWRRPEGRRLYWARLALAAFAAILIVALFGKGIAWQLSLHIEDTFIASLLPLALFGLAFAVLNLKAPLKASKKFSIWHFAVILILVIDLLWSGWGLNPGVDLQFYEDTQIAPQIASELTEGERIYLSRVDENKLKFEQFFLFSSFSSNLPVDELRSVHLPNLNVLDSIASANNFDPLVIYRYSEFINLLENQSQLNQLEMLSGANVGVFAFLDRSDQLQAESVKAKGNVWFANCAIIVENLDLAKEKISGPDFSNRDIVVEIPQYEKLKDCGIEPTTVTKIEMTKQNSNILSLSVDAPSGGWLLIADSYYPGWHAYLDGQSIEMYPANIAFRALQIPPGNHELSLFYRPISFYSGAGISSFALLYLLASLRKIQKEAAH